MVRPLLSASFMNNVMSGAVRYVSSFCILATLAGPVTACSSGTNGGSSGVRGDGGTSSSSSALCDPEGSWSVHFQWSGWTPGELTMEVAADQTAKILAGGGVTATTGTWSTSSDSITWSFADGSRFTGNATASCAIASGHMNNTAGNTGSFTADKGDTTSSGGGDDGKCDGCTADSDCGRCERCQRSTCSCVARLTCR